MIENDRMEPQINFGKNIVSITIWKTVDIVNVFFFTQVVSAMHCFVQTLTLYLVNAVEWMELSASEA